MLNYCIDIVTPLTLSRKERRPMVDMEPAQYAQTVGVR